MSSVDKSSGKTFLSVQTIVLAELVWAVLALLFFLLFSSGQDRPAWYSPGTSIFEATSYITASILCFRNWRSSQIVSGRNVWLSLCLGMFSYFLGNLLFSYWELGLHLEPTVSPGDFFFLLTYVFLLIGMAQAVFSRRLNLELWQKGVVVLLGVIGIAIALALANSKPSSPANAWLEAPAYAQTAPAAHQAPAQAPKVKQPKAISTAQSAPSVPAQAKPVSAPIATPVSKTAETTTQQPAPPEWAEKLEKQLQPLEAPVNLFYLVCDVLLLVLAATLLLAFWGGRFSQSWRMIAAAAFCLYIADMWFKYATATNPNYKSGSLPEVFWVFSAVLFGIGAALEYDLSVRSRKAGSRRRA